MFRQTLSHLINCIIQDMYNISRIIFYRKKTIYQDCDRMHNMLFSACSNSVKDIKAACWWTLPNARKQGPQWHGTAACQHQWEERPMSVSEGKPLKVFHLAEGMQRLHQKRHRVASSHSQAPSICPRCPQHATAIQSELSL